MKYSGREESSMPVTEPGIISRLSIGLVLLITISVSVASAGIQDQIDLANASPVVIDPGTYEENVNLNKPYSVVGVNNPTVTADNVAVSTFKVTSDNAGIAGFSITGATSAAGVLLENASPRVLYNIIVGNNVGVQNDNASPADARYCYWGDGGTAARKGEPGVGGNNPASAGVNYQPHLTAPVTNGRFRYTGNQAFTLDNTGAGVKVEVNGGTNSNVLGGSAAYTGLPYGAVSLPGIPLRFVDAFVEGNTGGTATVTVSYAGYDLSAVTEGSLDMYFWTGTTWARFSSVVRNSNTKKVSGTTSSSALTGTPIALAGSNYSVTIAPPSNPATIYTSKPSFTTFNVESTEDILKVYYQIDGHESGEWTAININDLNAKIWTWPGWSMTDDEWANLAQGPHTIYFMFTRTGVDPAVGDRDDDRIVWQFFKSTQVSYVTLLTPNGGETLNRRPYTISWDMPTPSDVYSVTLTYSRDGGLTYPYLIANLLGPYESYDWRSPNIRTDQARVKVTVRYNNGLEYSDTSDANFTITKGYSLFSWRPSFSYTSFRTWVKPPYSFRAG